jgi:hypothetical protein
MRREGLIEVAEGDPNDPHRVRLPREWRSD